MKKYKKTCKYLNYVEQVLILALIISEEVSIFFIILQVGTIGITRSAVGLKICAVTAGIKSYKSVSKKKKEKHDKIGLLGKIS